jgi:phosphatidylethanolamine/phosphatidyl-N-methylethanolamine N-methyltransferase
MHLPRPNEGDRVGLSDEAHFLKSLLQSPRSTGALAPSGRALAKAMAAAVGAPAKGLVVELGPGTGPVTKALIERGVPRERLVLIEHDKRFCRMLAQRFAPARVVQGDAYDLENTLREFSGKSIAAIVSSLPLLNEPPYKRERLLSEAFALMGPAGLFVQFTYGFVSPVPREACADRFSARGGAPIWRNLPPARVWTYRAEGGGAAIEPIFVRLRRKADALGEDWSKKGREAGDALKRRREILKVRLVRQAAEARERMERVRGAAKRSRAEDETR